MKILLSILLVWLTATTSLAFDFQHRHFDSLLKKYVHWDSAGVASQVDYTGLKRDKRQLKQYLDELSRVSQAEFNTWSKPDRLAFLINAYNGFTIELILSRYPDLDSIKELGSLFSSPWSKRYFTLFGKKRSLDEVEHKMIRVPGAYDDPRIHVAVVCASIGCPALRPEAFTGATVDRQLEDSLRRFLSDRSRNRYNQQNATLEVSKIFDWYADDFARGFRGKASVSEFLADYAEVLTGDEPGRQRIRTGRAAIDFLDYNWKLNQTTPARETTNE